MGRQRKPELEPKAFLASVGTGRTLLDYRKNQQIFAQGGRADAIFYIQQGVVKLTVVSMAGKEAVISILGADSFFGEGCLCGQRLHSESATAMSDCSIMRLEKDHVTPVLHTQPALTEFFLQHALARKIRIEEDLADHLFNNSEKRLARALLLLANFEEEGKPATITPKISQEMLAEIVGTTRSRVSFFLNRFRKLGFIDYNGQLRVFESLLSVIQHD